VRWFTKYNLNVLNCPKARSGSIPCQGWWLEETWHTTIRLCSECGTTKWQHTNPKQHSCKNGKFWSLTRPATIIQKPCSTSNTIEILPSEYNIDTCQRSDSSSANCHPLTLFCCIQTLRWSSWLHADSASTWFQKTVSLAGNCWTRFSVPR